MSVIHHKETGTTTEAVPAAHRSTSTDLEPGTPVARRVLAALRIMFGLTFLWAFFDKLLALGFHTGYTTDPATGAETLDRFGDGAWINGASPTEGFLKFGADGPFKEFYNSIAGDAWADWLLMLGLAGIGLALTLGIGMRFAAAAGALLYVMMWTVVLPPENNPVLDDHLLGAVTLVALALLHADRTWGLGRMWAKLPVVKNSPILK